jgi:hypothetical protein
MQPVTLLCSCWQMAPCSPTQVRGGRGKAGLGKVVLLAPTYLLDVSSMHVHVPALLWHPGAGSCITQRVAVAALSHHCPLPCAPLTGKVFPLAQWAEAVAHSMKGARGGKVLLQCD